MTPIQALEVRAADIRRRLGEIGGMAHDEITDEITGELSTLRAEHAANELQQTALKISDAPITPVESRSSEGMEFRQLIERSNVGEIFHVAINGGATTGATAELQKHYGLEVRSVPLAMLITNLPTDAQLETRATAAPSDVGRNQQGILGYVFPAIRSDVSRTGHAFCANRRRGVPDFDNGSHGWQHRQRARRLRNLPGHSRLMF